MNIHICDDEEIFLEDIKKIVYECCVGSNIRTFSDGKSLLDSLCEENADVLLLDIDMPEMNGMEVAKRISLMEKKPILIFVTSHNELVYESFKFHPYGFVRKEHASVELPKMLEDCVAELKLKTKHFCFKTDGKNIRLLISEIMYFESEANYVKVFTKDCEYRFRSTMTAVENSLNTYGFIRIHKGFLVNQEAVMLIGSDEARLVNGQVLPMGKTYVDSAKRELMRYMR